MGGVFRMYYPSFMRILAKLGAYVPILVFGLV